jgi:hypothetical protein
MIAKTRRNTKTTWTTHQREPDLLRTNWVLDHSGIITKLIILKIATWQKKHQTLKHNNSGKGIGIQILATIYHNTGLKHIPNSHQAQHQTCKPKPTNSSFCCSKCLGHSRVQVLHAKLLTKRANHQTWQQFKLLQISWTFVQVSPAITKCAIHQTQRQFKLLQISWTFACSSSSRQTDDKL